jgi:flagellar basal-body rod protein FlgG
MPAITSTPWFSPRESTRATNETPGRSVTSGSWVRSSSVWMPTTGSMPTEWRVAADHRSGMDRGLYIAASGMLAEQIRQDQIANDLANASTPGYKADRTSQHTFNDLLLQNSATGATVGPQSTAVQVDKIVTDFTAQPVKDTGEPLDFAIVGDGFFAVQTPQGTRYTRNGQFALDAQGRLTTAGGNPVLDANGRTITANNGTVDPRRIGVVALNNPVKQGDSLVTGTPAGAAAGTVRSGALEASGADAARSMVDMIDSMRAFEAGQKVIQAIDETLGKAATQVGSTN